MAKALLTSQVRLLYQGYEILYVIDLQFVGESRELLSLVQNKLSINIKEVSLIFIGLVRLALPFTSRHLFLNSIYIFNTMYPPFFAFKAIEEEQQKRI